jgi:magnesium transporter
MISVYVPRAASLERMEIAGDGAIPDDAVWIDLLTPPYDEDKLVERALGVAVPTREEMLEIEVTSRLYVENGALYMTATLMCQSDSENPKTTAVTFILAGHRLVTVRYDEPRPFTIVGNKLTRRCPAHIRGETVMMELLDAVIDRSADILEKIGADVDRVSHDIFEPEGSAADRTRSYNEILKTIGRKGDLASKVRESLVSIGRLLLYLANEADSTKWAKDQRAQLKGMQRDVQSVTLRSRHLFVEQDSVSARCHARYGGPRTEQHHQDLLGRGGRADAADLDRLDLRHEFQEHAGTGLGTRLSSRPGLDANRGRSALFFLQMEKVAVGGDADQTCWPPLM